MTELSMGDRVAILSFGRVKRGGQICRETAKYWVLQDEAKVSKATGRVSGGSSGSYEKAVPMTEKYSAELTANRAAAAIEKQVNRNKSRLSNYLDYMQRGYFQNLTPDQIESVLKSCESIIGEI